MLETAMIPMMRLITKVLLLTSEDYERRTCKKYRIVDEESIDSNAAFDKLLNQILKKKTSTAPNTKPIYGDQNLLTEKEDVKELMLIEHSCSTDAYARGSGG
jgi:hypothetical protein